MVKTKIPAGQSQKQSQKVVVNINERRVKRKRRVRRVRRDGKKDGVSQYAAQQYIAPPILIQPSMPYQPQVQIPQILRDTTYDNVKTGIDVLTAREPSNEEMHKARMEKFNAPSLADSFAYSEISSRTDNTPMLSKLSSRTDNSAKASTISYDDSVITRSTESVKSMPYTKLYDEVSVGSVQQNPLFAPATPQQTPLLQQPEYSRPFASAQNVPISEKQVISKDKTQVAREVRTAMQRSQGVGSNVPTAALLSGRFNLEGEPRRSQPTAEQKKRLEEAGQPYRPRPRQAGKK